MRYTNKVQLNCIVYINIPAALPRQRIELRFDAGFSVEASFECRFDRVEVREGPFSSSPLIGRFCGSASPDPVLSGGRFVWVRFSSDNELEGTGFQVRYHFTAGNTTRPTRTLLPQRRPGASGSVCLCPPEGKLVSFIACLCFVLSPPPLHSLSPFWGVSRVFVFVSLLLLFHSLCPCPRPLCPCRQQVRI